MTRSAYGSGSAREVTPGRWQLRLSLGTDPVTGKHRRATKTVSAGNAKAARKELGAFLNEQHGSRHGATLASLIDEYLDARHGMSPSTRADFEGYTKRYIPDHLARTKLGELTTRHLDALYVHLVRKGGVGGNQLAASTVHRLHTILHAALEQAVDWNYITANPANRARPPKAERSEVMLPEVDQLVALLAAVDLLTLDRPKQPAEKFGVGSPLPDFLALLLGTGARPGELCALPWGDLDLDTGRATIDQSVARGKGTAVVKTTKTNRGRRVNLPATVVDVLKDRLTRWRPAILAAGVPLADFPVFPSKGRASRPWRPDSMSREFRTVRDELELGEDLTLRNLRHYCVSVLASQGVDVVTVAKRMGHSPQIMLTVYAHMFEAGDQAAADLLEAHTAGLRKS